MPSWKKVITSGSDAALASLSVTNAVTATSFTGSLLGTAATASYVNTLRQNVTLSGSLNITGSTVQVGNNTLLGNTLLSGSIVISGSTTTPGAPTVRVYGDMQTDGVIKFTPVNKNIDTSISASYIYVSGSSNDLYFSQNGDGYANITRLRWLEGNLYTGLLNGGLITAVTGSTTFNLSSGSGIVVDLNASLSDNPYPTIQYVNWGNFTSQPLTYRTSSIQTYLGIDSSGNITQQTTPFINGEYNAQILIGTVLHQNLSTINGSITYPNVAYGWKQRSYDFIKAFGPLKLSGLNIIPSSSLGLNVSSGTAWADGRNYQTDPNNPSYITDSGTTVSKIFRYYQSGSSFVQDTNGGVGYTVIDPANYNPNGSGSLQPVPGTGTNREWSTQRIFWYPNSATKGIVVYYGSTTYANEIDAAANLPYEQFQEVENTKQNAVYLGAILVRNNGDFTDSTSYKILPGGIFRSVGGSGGGGSITSLLLSQLGDATITGPTDGQALVYNTATSKWINASNISASISGNAATATSASYALTASYTPGSGTAISSSFASTASFYGGSVVSASYALTASYAATASFVNTAQTASFYGGSVTSASFASTASFYGGSVVSASYASSTNNIANAINNNTDNYLLTAQGTGVVNGESLLQFDGQKLSVLYQSGDEGGEILLGKAATNTSLTGSGVTIDVWQNKLRFFEQGGAARGAFIDLTAASAGVGSNLLAGGGGTVTSVGGQGTVSGITLTGTVTSSGSLTLGGSISGLTNSNLSGTAGITNANLANSAVTVGSTSISLGSSATTIAGLSSVTSTSFTGSLQGTSSWATNVVNNGVTSVSASGTVSGITLTGGPITSTGTIVLGGSISGLTNSNLSGTAGITNANLANSSITVGSTAISLGSTATTITGLSSVTSTSFTGSLSGTSSFATNVVGGIGVTSVGTSGTVSGITLTGGTITSTGTITLGGSISGLTTSNLSPSAAITNGQLANSAITIAGVSTALGSSITQAQILAASGVWSGSAQIPNSSITGAQLATSYLPSAGGTITGNLVVNGTASISYLDVVFQSSSIIYSSGSNQLGDTASDTQSLFGAVRVTGSLSVTGSATATSFNGPLVGTASWATNVVGGVGVTSVATAGTVSGITLTGGTITSTGTITLGGSISGLTNSNLSGTAGITNANLANSSVTIGSTAISLGSSATTLAGLASVTSTSFTGSLLGTSSYTLKSDYAVNTYASNNYAMNSLGVGTSATGTAGNITATTVNATTFTGALTGNASTATQTTTTVSAGSDADLLYATVGSNDFFRLRVGGASNAGYVEIATADDATEPIYVRQYSGVFSTLARTATLLDSSGNTSFPQAVTAASFTGSIQGTATTATTALATTAALTAGSYLTSGGTFNGSTARTFAVDATDANTASKVVARDASGNFAAGTITAALQGTASWATNLVGGNGVTSVATAGTVSGITLTGGTITSTGTITLGGSISGLTTSNLSATAAIANSQLANSTISGIALGNNLGTHTAGSGLSGTSYNGALNQTWTVDSGSMLPFYSSSIFSKVSGDITITAGGVAAIGSSKVTSAMIVDDTIVNADINSAAAIAYTKLNLASSGIFSGSVQVNGAQITNNSVTVGSTAITLGSSSTTLAGLSSVTSTNFTGSLLGTSSWATNATSATSATTATNATNVAVTDTTTGIGPYYIAFTDGTTGNRAVRVDSTTLTFNATTNTVTAGTFSGALSGNASTATSASFASTSSWASNVVGGIGVTSVATSGTVSGITLTGGTITSTGTITLGGSISGLTTSNLSATAAIANSQLANSTISGIALGNSLNALTAGSGLSMGGLTYNGGTARTIAIDSTVVTLTDVQSLSNKTIAAGSNTITGLTNSNLSGTAGITNANLANSSITVGSTAISLGSSATTIAGLASVTSTSFTGSLSGNASTSTAFSTNRSNYFGITNGTVAGQLMWKAYGNNHTIFDASNGDTPSGTSCSKTNPDVAWSSNYPTLMGWNGTNTYGVRVDSANTATSATTATNVVGGANRVLFNNATDTTTTDANLTWNGATFNVGGTLTATVKSFIIDHPTKPEKKLQYGVLEGPEHSVFVRGRIKNADYIALPDYWHALVDENTITVNLTPVGKKQDVWVEETSEYGIKIGYDSDTVDCFYTIYAERKDIDKLVTEFDK